MADDNKLMISDEFTLKDKIYIIRGRQVMLDSDLAELYGYETRYLNLQVKHNRNRFPDDFMFQLTKEEYDNLMLNNSTSSYGGRRKMPYVFTEQGVYQLATVLKGKRLTAITRISDTDEYKPVIKAMLSNPILVLR